MKSSSDLQRYRMRLAFDGTHYYGWQRLGHVSPTIQEVLEEALSEFFAQKITVMGSGRTDAGVHSRGQEAHFDAPLDPKRITKLHRALQRLTPHDIIIRKVWLAPPDFHALASSLKKTYVYKVQTGGDPDIFQLRYSHWHNKELNLERLQAYADFLVEKQDFKSFMTSGSTVKTTVREMFEAQWKQKNRHQFEFWITGGGFLKQMVRNLVGTMLDLDKTREPPIAMKKILEARDRRRALSTAPAQGLTMHKVHYPEVLDRRCRRI